MDFCRTFTVTYLPSATRTLAGNLSWPNHICQMCKKLPTWLKYSFSFGHTAVGFQTSVYLLLDWWWTRNCKCRETRQTTWSLQWCAGIKEHNIICQVGKCVAKSWTLQYIWMVYYPGYFLWWKVTVLSSRRCNIVLLPLISSSIFDCYFSRKTSSICRLPEETPFC